MIHNYKAFLFGAAFLTTTLNSFSMAPAAAPMDDFDEFDEYAVTQVNDPFESFNRVIFSFNDGFYTHLAEPVVKTYRKTVPSPVRTGLGNFYTNIRYPVRFVSSVLQGKFHRAGLETEKFVVNTLGGLGGFIDQASNVQGLADVPPEDLGQTFGVWGIGQGPYVVIPFIGGTTVRDFAGRMGDTLLAPPGWKYLEIGDFRFEDELNWQTEMLISVTDTLSSLDPAMDVYQQMKSAALDPYLAVRDGLIAYRKKQVKE